MTTMPLEKDSDRSNLAPERGSEKKVWWIVILLIFLGGIVFVFGVGIYRYQWDNSATRVVSKLVPYPVAIVDGSIIRYSDFQEDMRLLKSFYEEEKTRAVAGSLFPSDEDIKKRVLDRLVKERLAEKLAKRYGIAISSSDVNTSYESTILDQTLRAGVPSQKAQAEVKAEKTLKDLYGLSSSRFKSKILYPFLVRRALVNAIRSDDEINAEKLKKSEEALKAVREGMDFGEAVLLFSEDPNAVNTKGDRGTLGRGLLPKEVEDVVFTMRPGDVSDVIRSPLGYHIIKVTDIREQDGVVTHVTIQEILIKPISLDAYLEAQKRRVNIVVFVD